MFEGVLEPCLFDLDVQLLLRMRTQTRSAKRWIFLESVIDFPRVLLRGGSGKEITWLVGLYHFHRLRKCLE
jgi:hypothetical protein